MILLTVVALVAGCAVVSAQDVGAGTLEVGGFPAGGIFFKGGDDNTEVNFNDYVYGGGVTWYLNPMFGVEVEALGGIGIAQDVMYEDHIVYHNQVPNLFGVSGNIVVFPGGSQRRVVGYVTAGVGTLRLLSRDQTAQFAMYESETHLATNVGGGVKFFRGGDARNWGWRGDYRLVMVNENSDAVPFFASSKSRYGHRISVGMFYTLRR
jgi:hypothetical protein